MVQLDSLRAFAVAAVVLSHLGLHSDFVQRIGWGRLGVELFFVLSGYLITRILLTARTAVDEGTEPRGTAIRLFYIRRCLRIFPIYYLTLFVTAAIGIHPVRQTLLWHLSYLSNVYFSLRGAFDGPISPLWSLAVEEQFYLLWPWFILFLPRRALRSFIVATIFVGPLWRLACVALGANDIATETITFGCLDLLAIGALLAESRWSERDEAPLRRFAFPALIVAGIALLLVAFSIGLRAELVYGRFARALVFVWIVARASEGFGGGVGKLLSFRPIAAIGRISYGIYLLHAFTPELAMKFFHYALARPYPQSAAAQHLIAVVGTVAGAAISWRYFEAPINRFKERFHAEPVAMHEPAVAES
jgi:peptidoglycan/LPS O-acetylase OafA/YrhL